MKQTITITNQTNIQRQLTRQIKHKTKQTRTQTNKTNMQQQLKQQIKHNITQAITHIKQ